MGCDSGWTAIVHAGDWYRSVGLVKGTSEDGGDSRVPRREKAPWSTSGETQ